MADKDQSEMDKIKEPGQDDKGKEPTLAEVQAELERVRKALKDANSESADRRKKLEALEADENKRKDAEKTELQKALDKAAALETQVTQARESAAKAARVHAVEIAAAKLGFTDPADALSLIDAGALKVSEDGKVEGVDEALKDLAKRKPYLIKTGKEKTDIDGDKRSSGGTKTAEELLAAKRSQYPGF